MAYLIEIPLLPFLGFPHTPFLTVIASLTTLSTVSQPSGKDAARLFLYPHIRFPPLPLLLQKLQKIRACIPI